MIPRASSSRGFDSPSRKHLLKHGFRIGVVDLMERMASLVGAYRSQAIETVARHDNLIVLLARASVLVRERHDKSGIRVPCSWGEWSRSCV